MTYSNEERERILARSRETIRRVDAMPDDRGERAEKFNFRQSAAAHDFSEPRTETRNQRHVREIEEQEMKFARERRREASTIEQRVDRQLAAERAAWTAEIASLRGSVLDIAHGVNEAVEAIDTAISELRVAAHAPPLVAQPWGVVVISTVTGLFWGLNAPGSRLSHKTSLSPLQRTVSNSLLKSAVEPAFAETVRAARAVTAIRVFFILGCPLRCGGNFSSMRCQVPPLACPQTARPPVGSWILSFRARVFA